MRKLSARVSRGKVEKARRLEIARRLEMARELGG